ncbi:unnamed protein product [Rhizoctonia solani]|nr:unnamed protein product [Rhizoctonia solani]
MGSPQTTTMWRERRRGYKNLVIGISVLMVSFVVLVSLAISVIPAIGASIQLGDSKGKGFTYEVVPGYFIQTNADTNPSTVGPNPPAFGLIANTSSAYWSDFKANITKLQKNAPKNVKYAVCWFGRHGQGWHNLAESAYGTAAWDDYWSKLNGDGNMTWGPDALLTDLGKQQAQLAHNTWVTELAKSDPVPLPSKLFSSPMSRAASTLDITFTRVLLTESGKDDKVRPYVMEGLREVIGVHTCDKRRTKAYIRDAYNDFRIEPGFTEEDELWTADHRETNTETDARLKATLDTIFGRLLGSKDTFISVTAHSGAINSALRVLGHRAYSLPTGGVIPVVIKATEN